MSFEIAHQWTLRCDGTTSTTSTTTTSRSSSGGAAGPGRCERVWTGLADSDHDDIVVVILFDAPELVAGDGEALAADGWLVCRDHSVLCPSCRQAHADTTWAALTSTSTDFPADTSTHRGPGGAR